METVRLVKLAYAYRHRVLPAARAEIDRWETIAARSENAELALGKIRGERRNVESAAFFALLAGPGWQPAIRRIVAFQLAYEYLDGLNEQHPNLRDGLTMHKALSGERAVSGYLGALVTSCRHTAPRTTALTAAVRRVGEAQARNHAGVGLQRWAERAVPSLAWWEGAAAGISSLDILAMLASPPEHHPRIAGSYVEVCALSGLLDGLVDRATDEPENHNWVDHYASREETLCRLDALIRQAARAVAGLPDPLPHQMILAGLLAHNLLIADEDARARLSRSARFTRLGMLLIGDSGH